MKNVTIQFKFRPFFKFFFYYKRNLKICINKKKQKGNKIVFFKKEASLNPHQLLVLVLLHLGQMYILPVSSPRAWTDSHQFQLTSEKRLDAFMDMCAKKKKNKNKNIPNQRQQQK